MYLFFCLKTTTTKNLKNTHIYTQTHLHRYSYPTKPKKNVCYLKILNLNVNSRMKIYWIKNHVKQTIKKEYQKKSLKIAMFQLIFRWFCFLFWLLLLLFGMAMLYFISDCLSIGMMAHTILSVWIRVMLRIL